MIHKTSSREFEKYGSCYDNTVNKNNVELITKELIVTGQIITHMYYFDCPVYIELLEGMADILIGDQTNPESLEVFAIHHYLLIKPYKYFNIFPVSDKIKCFLITPSDYRLKTDFLNPPYIYRKMVSKITIKELLGYYYVIKSPNYHFTGETHSHYELTYVDNGSLQTKVEDKTYNINAYELMLYGPNQFHTQSIITDSSCSYLTLIFDMDIDEDSDLLNKVFVASSDIHQTLKKFINETSDDHPYSKTLMLCLLQEIVIYLKRYNENTIDKPAYISSNQHFQDDLLNKILDHIEKNITQPLTIEEICLNFSLSRSSLQTLFKNHLNISPKNYIIKMKLQKSKELISENKYTISEIAFMLGFSSIHYFSRTFKQHFDVTPSDYARQIYKN